MNRIIKFFLTVLMFFTLLSCNEHKYKNVQSFSMLDIKEKKHLAGVIIDVDEPIMPASLFLKDSLLFTINMRQYNFVTVFDLKNMKKIGDFISFGSGPNEALYISDLQFQDSIVWAYDKRLCQIYRYQFNQFFNEKEVIPCEKIELDDSFNKLLITKNKLIINSMKHIRSRFSFYDLNGNFIENKGELPESNIDMTDFELLESYFCNMALNPHDESIFVAYMNTDLIEIYDSNGNLKTRKHGPDKFFPVKKQQTMGNATTVGFIAGKSRFAYLYPVAFEDEIWTIYDGKYIDPTIENNFLCNKIIVFDWEGKPIRQYTTNIGFYGLAIDRKNRIFYGITLNPEYTFVKFNY